MGKEDEPQTSKTRSEIKDLSLPLHFTDKEMEAEHGDMI